MVDNSVSIVMIVYNQAGFIENSIKSILSLETFPDEIIIADDCSTDESYEILSKYEDILKTRIPKVVLYKNDINLGIYKNWEKALLQVSSNFICAAAGDDLLETFSISQIKSDLSDLRDFPGNVILVYNYKLVRKNRVVIWDNYKFKNFDIKLALLQNILSHRNFCISKNILLESPLQSDLLTSNPNFGYGVDLIKKLLYHDLVDKYIFINKEVGSYVAGIGVSSLNISTRTKNEISTYKYLLEIIEIQYHSYIQYRIFAAKYSLHPFNFSYLGLSLYYLFYSKLKHNQVYILRNLKFLIPTLVFNYIKRLIYV